MINNKAGPCPKCGGWGTIQNGVYEVVDQILDVILKDLQGRPQQVFQLRSLFERAKSEQLEMPELKAAIEEELPVFASIADFFPETKSELYEFVTMLLTALTFIYMMLTSHPEAPPTATQVINTIIERPAAAPIASSPMPGRNDPCYCGSGKKYKKCHGATAKR